MDAVHAGCAVAAATIPLVPKERPTVRELQSRVVAVAPKLVKLKTDPDAKLLGLCQKWWAAKRESDRVFSLDGSSDDDKRGAVDRQDRILRRIAKHDAKSVRGFSAKMHVFRNCAAIELTHLDPCAGEALLLSVAEDSKRLFPMSDCEEAPTPETEDPVVAVGEKIEQLNARRNKLWGIARGSIIARDERDQIDDDLASLRGFLTTLKPQSIEGVLFLLSRCLHLGDEATDDTAYEQDRREKAYRQQKRALWAVSEYLMDEFGVDGREIGAFPLEGDIHNPWLTTERATELMREWDKQRLSETSAAA